MTPGAAGPQTAEAAGDGKPGVAERAEQAVAVAAVVQGAAVGAWLVLLPAMALRVGGFPAAPLFFVRWAGVLQLVLAIGYAMEWRRFRKVTLLVASKTVVALFLAASAQGEELPWPMILAIPLEAVLAVAAAVLHGPAQRSRKARGARLRLVAAAKPPARSAAQR